MESKRTRARTKVEHREEDQTRNYKCRSCGIEFDSFGDMQRHELVKHVQDGIGN